MASTLILPPNILGRRYSTHTGEQKLSFASLRICPLFPHLFSTMPFFPSLFVYDFRLQPHLLQHEDCRLTQSTLCYHAGLLSTNQHSIAIISCPPLSQPLGAFSGLAADRSRIAPKSIPKSLMQAKNIPTHFIIYRILPPSILLHHAKIVCLFCKARIMPPPAISTQCLTSHTA